MIEPRRFWIDNYHRRLKAAEAVMALDVGPNRVAEVVIRPARKEKTTSQRGYWHVLLDRLGQDLGYTRGQMKKIVKDEYYGTDTVTMPDGRKYELEQSSEEEDRQGYGRLIDFTLQFAAEQGVLLPDPRLPRSIT